MTEPSLPEKVLALDGALGDAEIPHAFGGAFALAYYAEPRATIDVDVNVFVEPTEAAAVRAALEPLGVDPSRSPAHEIERDGQGRWWWGRNPVDLFFAYHTVHQAMAQATRIVDFGESSIPILSPEHLVVCKAMFDRAKDWIDIDQVFATRTDLDVAEIKRWLVDIVGGGGGGDDDRVQRIDDLAARTRESR